MKADCKILVEQGLVMAIGFVIHTISFSVFKSSIFSNVLDFTIPKAYVFSLLMADGGKLPKGGLFNILVRKSKIPYQLKGPWFHHRSGGGVHYILSQKMWSLTFSKPPAEDDKEVVEQQRGKSFLLGDRGNNRPCYFLVGRMQHGRQGESPEDGKGGITEAPLQWIHDEDEMTPIKVPIFLETVSSVNFVKMDVGEATSTILPRAKLKATSTDILEVKLAISIMSKLQATALNFLRAKLATSMKLIWTDLAGTLHLIKYMGLADYLASNYPEAVVSTNYQDALGVSSTNVAPVRVAEQPSRKE